MLYAQFTLMNSNGDTLVVSVVPGNNALQSACT
jgi:hypothetical protein